LHDCCSPPFDNRTTLFASYRVDSQTKLDTNRHNCKQYHPARVLKTYHPVPFSGKPRFPARHTASVLVLSGTSVGQSAWSVATPPTKTHRCLVNEMKRDRPTAGQKKLHRNAGHVIVDLRCAATCGLRLEIFGLKCCSKFDVVRKIISRCKIIIHDLVTLTFDPIKGCLFQLFTVCLL